MWAGASFWEKSGEAANAGAILSFSPAGPAPCTAPLPEPGCSGPGSPPSVERFVP